MPELPEVETVRRQLIAVGTTGRRIEQVRIDWPRLVEPLTPRAFAARARGREVRAVERWGKWLCLCLDNASGLWIHLRMTGGFSYSHGTLHRGPHERAWIRLADGLNLHFRDPRKFGRWRLGSAPTGLGPDALTVSAVDFEHRLRHRNKALKALLLDQSFVAGVGNIYADEALFRARLAPHTRSTSLSAPQCRNLWRAMRAVLQAGVRNGGTSLGAGQGNFVDLEGRSGGYRTKVKIYGRGGHPCPVCGHPLSKTQIAQRTTVYCDRCQS